MPPGLLPGLLARTEEEPGRAAHAGFLAPGQIRSRHGGREIDFGGNFDSLPTDIEQRYRAKSGPPQTKAFHVGGPIQAQPGDDAGPGDDHTRPNRRALWRRKQRGHNSITVWMQRVLVFGISSGIGNGSWVIPSLPAWAATSGSNRELTLRI